MIERINEQIFMGAGDHSLAQIGHLHQKLARAFCVLGGIQQPPSIHEPAESCEQHMQDIEEGEYEIQEIVREICVGLTGKKLPRSFFREPSN